MEFKLIHVIQWKNPSCNRELWEMNESFCKKHSIIRPLLMLCNGWHLGQCQYSWIEWIHSKIIVRLISTQHFSRVTLINILKILNKFKKNVFARCLRLSTWNNAPQALLYVTTSHYVTSHSKSFQTTCGGNMDACHGLNERTTEVT